MIRILVADDEPQIREGIKYVLADMVDEIYLAADGEKAYEIIVECEIDILITDIRMPILSGIEMLHAIREVGMDCKVIVISGYKNFTYAKEAIGLGAIDYILKPIREEDLKSAVSDCIDTIETERTAKAEDLRIREEMGTLALDYVKYVLFRFLKSDANSEEMERVDAEKHSFLRDLISYDYYFVAAIKKKGMSTDVFYLNGARTAFADMVDKYNNCVMPDGDDMLFVCMWNGDTADQDHGPGRAVFEARIIDLYSMWNTISSEDIYYGFGGTVTQFIEINESYKEAMDAIYLRAHGSNKSGRFFIDEVKKYINDHLQDDLSLNRVSEEFSFSPNYFSKLFSENVGITFRQYLIHERVDRAKVLLQDPKIKIYEISSMVGYWEARNLMKVFKNTTGMTMSEYRNQARREIRKHTFS